MRSELTDIRIIESYLLQTMSQEDRLLFEQKMNGDAQLAQSVKLQKAIMDRINFNAFKAEMLLNQANLIGGKKSFWTRNFYLNSVLILVGFFATALLITNWIDDNESAASITNQLDSKIELPNEDSQLTISKNYATQKKSRKVNYNPSPTKKSNQKFDFSKFEQKFISAKIIAEVGGTIITKDSKSSIHIPANILVDKQGNLISGEVEIKYREFRNPAEIAFSRIPMFYSENDIDYKFNSAGMIEVRAYQNGKELDIKPNSDFTIDYNVTAPLDNCYFFALDDKTQQWEKKQIIDFQNSKKRKGASDELSSVNGVMQRKYRGALSGTISSVWNTSNQTRSNRNTFENQIWGASVYLYYPLEYNRYSKPAYSANEVVNEFKITDIDTGRYIVEIVAEGHEKIVLDNLTIYANRRSELNAKLVTQFDSNIDRSFKVLRKLFSRREKLVEGQKLNSSYELIDTVEYYAIRPTWRNSGTNNTLTTGPTNSTATNPNLPVVLASEGLVQDLRCPSFGVYNCDQAQRIKEPIAINAEYKTKAGKTIFSAFSVVLIDLGINAAFSFWPTNFKCEKNGKNMLLLFTQDQKIFFLSKEKFDAMNISKKGDYSFEMEDITDKIKNSSDLKKFLGL